MLHGSYSSMTFIVFYTGGIIYQSFISVGSTYSSKEHLYIYTGFYIDFIALYTGDLFIYYGCYKEV